MESKKEHKRVNPEQCFAANEDAPATYENDFPVDIDEDFLQGIYASPHQEKMLKTDFSLKGFESTEYMDCEDGGLAYGTLKANTEGNKTPSASLDDLTPPVLARFGSSEASKTPPRSKADSSEILDPERGVPLRPHDVRPSYKAPHAATRKTKRIMQEHDLHPHDVVCGRSKIAFGHYGNKYFRMLVIQATPLYCETDSRKEKTRITKDIIAKIIGKGGSFLRDKGVCWVGLKAAEIHEKVSHALRDSVRRVARHESKSQIAGAQLDRPMSAPSRLEMSDSLTLLQRYLPTEYHQLDGTESAMAKLLAACDSEGIPSSTPTTASSELQDDNSLADQLPTLQPHLS